MMPSPFLFFSIHSLTYILITVLMSLGLYIIVCRRNLLQNLIGMNLFQTSLFMFFIFMGFLENGAIPIIGHFITTYSHPLPSVLTLTAIVVGAAHTSVGIALLMRIQQAYNTIDSKMLEQKDKASHHMMIPAPIIPNKISPPPDKKSI